MTINELIETVPSTGSMWNYTAQNIVIVLGLLGAFVYVFLNSLQIFSKKGNRNITVSFFLSLYSFSMFLALGAWNINRNPVDVWENKHLTTYLSEQGESILGSELIEHVTIKDAKGIADVDLLDKNSSFSEEVTVEYIDEGKQPYITYKQLEKDIVIKGETYLSKDDFVRPVIHIPRNMEINWVEKE